MQVFIPFESFRKNAECLDDKRRYKQAVEIKQLLQIIKYLDQGLTEYPAGHKKEGKKIGYLNHPVVKMWRPYPEALRYYQFCLLNYWIRERWGFRFSLEDAQILLLEAMENLPSFRGSEIHKQHQQILLNKNKEHYQRWFK